MCCSLFSVRSPIVLDAWYSRNTSLNVIAAGATTIVCLLLTHTPPAQAFWNRFNPGEGGVYLWSCVHEDPAAATDYAMRTLAQTYRQDFATMAGRYLAVGDAWLRSAALELAGQIVDVCVDELMLDGERLEELEPLLR